MLALLLLVAACGKADGGSQVATGGGHASASTSAAPGAQGDPFKFAQCMRDNGITNFPDPGAAGSVGGNGPPAGSTTEEVTAATAKCKQYLPNGGEMPKTNPEELDRQRRFAQCMRANGVLDFPDPQGDGGSRSIPLDKANSPAFKAAQAKCETLVPRPSSDPGGPGRVIG
ncbi:MAG: hypothetical protein V7603_6669 [Micromonosporaceae bacterium]